ncbi:hypothetical protein HispidOSU_009922 [Sigmodon hispidus]
MIHAAAPRTHRRRHRDAGCSGAPSAVGTTVTDTHGSRGLKRAVARGRLRWPKADARVARGATTLVPQTPQGPSSYRDAGRSAPFREVGDTIPALALIRGRTSRGGEPGVERPSSAMRPGSKSFFHLRLMETIASSLWATSLTLSSRPT